MIGKKCPEEISVTLYINHCEMVTIQLGNGDWDDWVVGYLFSEGMIDGVDELSTVFLNEKQGKIWVELRNDRDMEALQQRRRYITAGCGKGITFRSMKEVSQFEKIRCSPDASLPYLQQKMREFAKHTPMYQETGGMHAACLLKPDGGLVVREDIGRHNAVDKVIGHALKQHLHPDDLILLTTGRISYEMLSKAARFGVGLIGSRSAATRQALELAEQLQMEVVGYIRGGGATVYTKENRVIACDKEAL